MIRFSHDQLIAFDVDDTLVYCEKPDFLNPEDGIVVNQYGTPTLVFPHQKHIEYLKSEFNKGRGIIVWSQTGSEWAEEVVNALNLRLFVHLVMVKPAYCVDDLPVSEWMERKFIKEIKKEDL